MVAEALAHSGLAAELVRERRLFLEEMILKGLWNCVVGLPLAVHDVDLETYLRVHAEEARGLCDEGARAASAEYGARVDGERAFGRLLDTTRELGWVMYFSFVTLTTLGYGDITPVSDAARVIAILEAALGQLFLVTLVARLVSIYSSPSSEVVASTAVEERSG